MADRLVAGRTLERGQHPLAAVGRTTIHARRACRGRRIEEIGELQIHVDEGLDLGVAGQAQADPGDTKAPATGGGGLGQLGRVQDARGEVLGRGGLEHEQNRPTMAPSSVRYTVLRSGIT